jgi:hypothetical protein
LEQTNSEIAEKLSLSAGTVKNRVNVIYGKLGVNTRIAAHQWLSRMISPEARRRGLLLPPKNLESLEIVTLVMRNSDFWHLFARHPRCKFVRSYNK